MRTPIDVSWYLAHGALVCVEATVDTKRVVLTAPEARALLEQLTDALIEGCAASAAEVARHRAAQRGEAVTP